MALTIYIIARLMEEKDNGLSKCLQDIETARRDESSSLAKENEPPSKKVTCTNKKRKLPTSESKTDEGTTNNTARLQKQKKTAEVRLEKQEKAAAMRLQKQELLAILDERMEESTNTTLMIPLQRQPCTKPLRQTQLEEAPIPNQHSISLPPQQLHELQPVLDQEPRRLNAKGHTTLIIPLPRQPCPEPLLQTQLEEAPIPSQHSISLPPQQLHKLQPVLDQEPPRLNAKGHPMFAGKQPRKQPECSNCITLKREVQRLTYELSVARSGQGSSQSSLARPTAGIYDQEFANDNGMEELLPGCGVYFHIDEQRTAMKKAMGKDGRKIGRYIAIDGVLFHGNSEK